MFTRLGNHHFQWVKLPFLMVKITIFGEKMVDNSTIPTFIHEFPRISQFLDLSIYINLHGAGGVAPDDRPGFASHQGGGSTSTWLGGVRCLVQRGDYIISIWTIE